jgi:hypothetical protein
LTFEGVHLVRAAMLRPGWCQVTRAVVRIRTGEPMRIPAAIAAMQMRAALRIEPRCVAPA